jgi:uncharacterized protein YyaL (SSP411 family)
MTTSKRKKTNRLIKEKSPYLLQHAHNPVDWYPWGKNAFEQARIQDKPIFLSIGYSTCHWCHVMEKESFEDEEVAKLLNAHFICIKVDREERPDLDAIFMKTCQVMTHRGGWPLTIFMTSDKTPFFAGTYFPKKNRFNQPGLLDILPRLQILWEGHRDQLLTTSKEIISALQKTSSTSFIKKLDNAVLDTSFEELSGRFDEQHGGFGQKPKFPVPHDLFFLLRYWKRTGKDRALQMVEKTLQAMRQGGIYDHIGYGFHRYSTDQHWLVPHFEKMLYDQALLSITYTETYQATGKVFYKKTAEEILAYVVRDMMSSEGAFYSAEDADSEGQEGKFYMWTQADVLDVVDKKESDLAKRIFNLKAEGNYVDESAQSKTGMNILHTPLSINQMAKKINKNPDALKTEFESICKRLFLHREKRIHPFKDDKILTDWNGLMIVAFAKAAQAFDSTEYASIACKAADFILKEMTTESGELFHSFRKERSSIKGFCDDYAFMAWGLIELYETTFEVKYLKMALKFTQYLIKHFWDEKQGGFFFTSNSAEKQFIRPKDYHDGAIPSGNSVAAMNLLRLGRMTGNTKLTDTAELLFKAASNKVVVSPSVYTYLMSALELALGPSIEVVVSGIHDREDTQKMLKALRAEFIPHKVLLLNPVDVPHPEIHQVSPFTQNQPEINNKVTAYVCQEQSCKNPTNDIQEMLENLKNPNP